MQTSTKPRGPRPVGAEPAPISGVPVLTPNKNSGVICTAEELDQMTGPELMTYIAQFPSIDTMLDRDPYLKPLTQEELLLQVERSRAERALFNIKEQNKQNKRDGVIADDTESDS